MCGVSAVVSLGVVECVCVCVRLWIGVCVCVCVFRVVCLVVLVSGLRRGCWWQH